MRNEDVEALKAVGVDMATIARALEFSPIKTRIKLTHGACPACGCRAMAGDFVCGTCSEVYAGSPRRFWQYVYERLTGHVGRAIYEKPGPQQLPAQVEKPKSTRVLLTPREVVAEIAPEKREYLVTVGPVGRVVVAYSKAAAARVAHALNGDIPTAGHQILDMGLTSQAETEIAVDAKPEGSKKVKLVEHVFRVSGPGLEREMKLATVASSDKS
jgi:hypothetical protein